MCILVCDCVEKGTLVGTVKQICNNIEKDTKKFSSVAGSVIDGSISISGKNLAISMK